MQIAEVWCCSTAKKKAECIYVWNQSHKEETLKKKKRLSEIENIWKKIMELEEASNFQFVEGVMKKKNHVLTGVKRRLRILKVQKEKGHFVKNA